MITKSKIDWCDFTWNPVWGCLNHCPYCYARKIANRFAENLARKEITFRYKNIENELLLTSGFIDNRYNSLMYDLENFEPTWLESNYQKSFPKKPAKIFVNSMSDPMYWDQSWYEKIVKRIAENQQHTFIVLTKHPKIYEKYIFPSNTWLGVTATNNIDFCTALGYFSIFELQYKCFISIEPIQEKIRFDVFKKGINDFIDWIIVGPETGNRKDKYICTPEMLEPFFSLDITVLMKCACAKITDRQLRQEWPE